MVLGKGI